MSSIAPRRFKINYKYLITSFFVALILGILLSYLIFFIPNVNLKSHNQRFYIPRNSTFNSVFNKIKKRKLLKSNITFSIASQILGYKQRTRSGSYIFKPQMNNWKLIRSLRAGTQKPVKLVLHNIKTKTELIEKICLKLDMSTLELENTLNDQKILSKYGFNPYNILVMFIPNTYEIYWNISPLNLLQRMNREYIKFWNTTRIKKATKIKLSPIHVSILASLVQEETIKKDEAPIVAGVYRNRLRKKMRLMSCTTLKFANRKPNASRVLLSDRLIDSDYNTYKKSGLPPGPINIPEINNIDAVLNLVCHDYLYMCAKEDFSGRHYFTKTFGQHLKHARKYWKALNRSKIFR